MSHSQHQRSTVATADERDSARQLADLAALRRMLVVSEGCFSLSFAVCNDRTLRNDLIARLREEFPDLVVVELPVQTVDVYQTVCDQLAGKAPRGIFVLDLEGSIPYEAKAYPTLRSLNSSRELWEPLACPVVFWLADYAAARVARHAPDFWRYRSHQFEFVSDRTRVSQAIAEPFPGFEMVDGLPFEEKQFRVAELEERLREVGNPPSADLLPHALMWLYELAHLCRHASQFARARELLDRAICWTESAYGPNHSNTASALGHLGQLLQDTNRLVEAEPLLRRALAIDEQSFGKDHPHVALRLNNLAGVLHVTNRLADAEPLVRRALAIDEQSFGKDHPKVAVRLNNLAQLLQATNRLAEAEPLLRRALAISEQTFGKDHPNVAACLNNLATLLQTTSRRAEAEPLIRRALAIDEQSLGMDHPKVANRLNNLAHLLHATNRPAEAEPLMRRAMQIILNFMCQTGQLHPHLIQGIVGYSLLLQQMGMNEEAMKQRLGEIQDANR
jgi:tetratricopeptide (TPR) repeat protein